MFIPMVCEHDAQLSELAQVLQNWIFSRSGDGRLMIDELIAPRVPRAIRISQPAHGYRNPSNLRLVLHCASWT